MANKKRLALTSIRTDGGTKLRDLSEENVLRLVEVLEDGNRFVQNIRVFRDKDGEHWLSHGFHRHEAYCRNGNKMIEVELVKGSQQDALDDACRPENACHGLPETRKDREHRVKRYIEAHPGTSNRKTAEWCGVNQTTVGRYKRGEGGSNEPLATNKGGVGGTWPDVQDAPNNEPDETPTDDELDVAAVESEVTADLDDEDTPTVWTLDEWNALNKAEQADVLDLRDEGKSTFNQQTNVSIEWAKWSWNPVTGCLHGCKYCYAEDIAKRFFDHDFTPAFYPQRLGAPQRMKTPKVDGSGMRNVFTCSMADLFGKWVPAAWIEAVMESVRNAPDWNFIFLTKNPKALVDIEFPKNAWVGTTVDKQARAKSAEAAMKKVNASVKFVSVEPMLERIKFTDISIFDWIIIGGGSKSKRTAAWHPPNPWWADLEKAALDAGVEVYHKVNLYKRRTKWPLE